MYLSMDILVKLGKFSLRSLATGGGGAMEGTAGCSVGEPHRALQCEKLWFPSWLCSVFDTLGNGGSCSALRCAHKKRPPSSLLLKTLMIVSPLIIPLLSRPGLQEGDTEALPRNPAFSTESRLCASLQVGMWESQNPDPYR